MATKKGKKEYEQPTEMGYVWLKRRDSKNEKAPYLSGFVSLPEELVKGCEALESLCYYDEERGNYTLDISLWKNGNGVLSGKITKSWKLKDSKDSVDDELDLDDDDDDDDDAQEEEEDVIPFEMEKETKPKAKRARR